MVHNSLKNKLTVKKLTTDLEIYQIFQSPLMQYYLTPSFLHIEQYGIQDTM